MLVAWDKAGKVIHLLELEQTRIKAMKRQEFFCPGCKGRVILKCGEVKQPHFAHVHLTDCQMFSEGETPEHLALKEIFLNWANREYQAELECYLPELAQRPDILLDGLIALEIQCSPLTIERLVERTENYLLHKYKPIWLCGKKLHLKGKLSTLQRGLLYYSPQVGFYFWEIDLQMREIRLCYHLEENFRRECVYSVQSWKFGTTSLREIFATPFQERKLTGRKYQSVSLVKAYYQRLFQQLKIQKKECVELQGEFYQGGQSLLQLPTYYYFPALSSLACLGEIMNWKLILFTLLREGSYPVEELVQIFLSKDLHLYAMPAVPKEVIFSEFICQELFALAELRYLKVEEKRFSLVHPTFIKQVQPIPYAYDWKILPEHLSVLPRRENIC
ncbi:MAG: hypothetical protein LBM95_07050 [Lactobacillales bacterium]|jgi:competence protein CoiA|nr:hypothetical protein [Lactobacillales bacterium]